MMQAYKSEYGSELPRHIRKEFFGGEEEGLALYFSPPLDLSCKFSFYVLACRLAHHAVSLFLESKVFVAGFPIYPLMQ